jgi:uncharacterized peroxidase-related enzyme
MSPKPAVLETSMAFHGAPMHGPSPLSCARREMLATLVSREFGCPYGTQAHAHDLGADVVPTLARDDQEADRFVHAFVAEWRTAPLAAADRALYEFAVKLTHSQRAMSPADLGVLRAHGFDDRAVHDALQVVGYFNYVTRVADALGVVPETFLRPWGGPAAWGAGPGRHEHGNPV